MNEPIYTAITFAPVQGFIEKSRKLRDLYGSSYLLSYLSWAICNAAKSKGCQVVSPAVPNITQGMPNQIIIRGDFQEDDAKYALETAWKCVTESCREWIEKYVQDGWEYHSWQRIWRLWTKHTWEFFWVQGKRDETVSKVRQRLNDKKRCRGWTGINWQGESSTLSGIDAIAFPGLGLIADPRQFNYQQQKSEVRKFYEQLSQKLGESFIDLTPGLNFSGATRIEYSKIYGSSFIDPSEELSVPELIKRLITHKAIAQQLIARFTEAFGDDWMQIKGFHGITELSEDLNPESFKDLNRFQNNNFQGWFQGDGDKAGDYLKSFADTPQEAYKTKKFSIIMRNWGKYFQQNPPPNCRVIYAGGDDFLGVFYNAKTGQNLESNYCIDWFSRFKTQCWDTNQGNPKKKPITVSVGFVWAAPGIPQRDVLQHCREAEKSAKSQGRDRLACRVLFNNGNHLEWVCPWWLLEQGLLTSYSDRESKQNWTHIYNDVAVLESRHAFNENSTDIAFGLFEVYFPTQKSIIGKENWWNIYDAEEKLSQSGILGDRKNYYQDDTQIIDTAKVNTALNNWIINLAKVGFHLCQQ